MFKQAGQMFEYIIQTSAAEVQQPKVPKVSLFQVTELPTNMYDYTLPSACRISMESYTLPEQWLRITEFVTLITLNISI